MTSSRWKFLAMTILASAMAALLLSRLAAEAEPTSAGAKSGQSFSAANAPYALLWMANSAEYKALCHQTFNVALQYVKTQATQAKGKESGKKLAVVMDLDETVLNNLAYMTYLYKSGKGVSWDEWEHFEEKHGKDVVLVPGAIDFIRGVEKSGVEVCFISNRTENNRSYTVRTLKRLGVIEDEKELSGDGAHRLILLSDSSDKEERRKSLADRREVLAWVGDNLGDFPVGPRPETGQQRDRQVEDARDKWGAGFFILPNPTYGHWLKYIDPEHPENYLPAPGCDDPDCPLKTPAR